MKAVSASATTHPLALAAFLAGYRVRKLPDGRIVLGKLTLTRTPPDIDRIVSRDLHKYWD